MTQDLHWNTPLISRNRTDIARFFDGFTLVEPGLVRPAQWRPDPDNPLRQRQDDDEPVLRPIVPEPPEGDPGAHGTYADRHQGAALSPELAQGSVQRRRQ